MVKIEMTVPQAQAIIRALDTVPYSELRKSLALIDAYGNIVRTLQNEGVSV